MGHRKENLSIHRGEGMTDLNFFFLVVPFDCYRKYNKTELIGYVPRAAEMQVSLTVKF